jgi:hypothetical protein
MSTDFEKQLQRQPLRELPRDWRAEILATAAGPRPDSIQSRGDGVSAWPSLRAWAALAAVWPIIFLLQFTSPAEPQPAGNSPGMTMRSFAMLHEQTLLMAESFGQPNAGQPAAAVPAAAVPAAAVPAPPKPRSEIARRQLIG